MNCNGIEELCTQEPNISRRCELILRPGAVDCCFASCPNPILDPKLLFSQVLQAANFGADSGWQPPKTAFFAFANPWPNKPESAHFHVGRSMIVMMNSCTLCFSSILLAVYLRPKGNSSYGAGMHEMGARTPMFQIKSVDLKI